MTYDAQKKYEVIEPKVDLRTKVKPLRGKEATFDPIASAEAALERLSNNFGMWMDDETKRLQKIWSEAEENGINEHIHQELFRAAHDLKGQSATLGFPLAGRAASSLCNVLESTEIDNLPKALISQHVQAIRAMVNENAKDMTHKTAHQLVNSLFEVTAEFMETQKES